MSSAPRRAVPTAVRPLATGWHCAPIPIRSVFILEVSLAVALAGTDEHCVPIQVGFLIGSSCETCVRGVFADRDYAAEERIATMPFSIAIWLNHSSSAGYANADVRRHCAAQSLKRPQEGLRSCSQGHSIGPHYSGNHSSRRSSALAADCPQAAPSAVCRSTHIN